MPDCSIWFTFPCQSWLLLHQHYGIPSWLKAKRGGGKREKGAKKVSIIKMNHTSENVAFLCVDFSWNARLSLSLSLSLFPSFSFPSHSLFPAISFLSLIKLHDHRNGRSEKRKREDVKLQAILSLSLSLSFSSTDRIASRKANERAKERGARM